MKILSIDLGASKCEINLDSSSNIYRIGLFSNYLYKNNDGYIWDIDKIIYNIKYYIDKCIESYGKLDYLVNCSWGIDYVMFDNEDNIIYPCYSYRNKRTEKYFEKNCLHLKKKGINNSQNLTYYQLKSEKKKRLEKCKFILSISDAINFILSREKYWNYSIASTTGLFNLTDNNFDKNIINFLGIKDKLPPFSYYGQIIGKYKDINIISGLSHDTSSAIYSLKNNKIDEVYIICGTWCIIGILSDNIQTCNIANFTNESGYKNTRFLKNIVGLWLIQQISKNKNMDYKEIDRYGEEYSKNINIQPINLRKINSIENQNNIITVLKDICKEEGKYYDNNIGFFVKLIYISLINEFKESIIEIEKIKKIKIKKINVLGGGCKSIFFMKLLSDSFDIPISIHNKLNSSLGNIIFIKDILSKNKY